VQRRSTRLAMVGVALAAALGLALAFRAPLGRALLAGAVDLATGYTTSFDGVALGRDRAVIEGLRISYGGLPVVTAQTVRLRYELRDVWPGGAHRYGLVAVSVERPECVLVRRRDGSFVLRGAFGIGGGIAANAPQTPQAPLRFDLRLVDGRFALIDDARVLPRSRRLSIERIAGAAAVDSAGTTRYRVHGDVAGDPRDAFALGGRIDAGGYAYHRLTARTLPLASFVNYFINTPSASFETATLNDLDLRAYRFAAGNGAYHLAGSGTLAGAVMRIPGFATLARNLHGRIDVYDGGIAAPVLDGRLSDVAVSLGGGLFDWTAPALRLGIVAQADLARERRLFRFSRRVPVRGDAGLRALVEGAAGDPLVATRLSARRAWYGAYAIENAGGRILYAHNVVTLARVLGSYGGLAVGASGSIALGNPAYTRLVARVAGPVSNVPYLAQAAPGVVAVATGLVEGPEYAFDARGTLGGGGAGTALSGTFHVDALGDGTLGPFRFGRDDGASLAGSFTLERRRGISAFWLDAHDYPFADRGGRPRLPGLALVAPAFAGRLTGALAGDGPPSAFRTAGHLAASDLRVGGVRLARAESDVAGSLAHLRLGRTTGSGAFGRFAGHGAYEGGRLALDGAYAGSFERLAMFTGPLGATGPVTGPATLLLDGKRTVVQARGLRTNGARVDGLPLDDLRGTIGVRRGALDVYAVMARLAGGSVVVGGEPSANDGKAVALSIAGADAAAAVRVPHVRPGRMWALGTLSLSGRPTFRGAFAAGGGSFDGLPLAGNADVVYSGGGLAIRSADALLGPAVGSLTGTVSGVAHTGARYDLRFGVPAVSLGPLASIIHARNDVSGTAGGDFRVHGTFARPELEGRFVVPEGSAGGLAFRDAGALLEAAAGRYAARAGTMTVGSTTARFAASLGAGDATLALEAPRADLADFNDLFDTGDTLGGRGRIRAGFATRGGVVATSADVAVAGVRYRRFALGDLSAHWGSRNGSARGRIAFGGESGRLETVGTLSFPGHVPPGRVLGRSSFAGTATLRGLALGVWLPAVGYRAPIGGRVDADARISGPLGDPAIRTTATLVDGTLGPLPVDRLTVTASSTLRRTLIQQADLSLPALHVTASGRVATSGAGPLALALHANATDLRTLAARFPLAAALEPSGSAEADVKVVGTRLRPVIGGGFDIERAGLRGVQVPRALGEFTLSGRDLVLSGVELDFARGMLQLAGSVPFQVAPFGFGPARAPVTLDATAKAIDLASFAPLLPPGSALGGVLDGRLAVEGTAGAPRLAGALTLARGTVRTPLDATPLEDVAARVTFARNVATVESFYARAGGGSLDGGGSLRIRDFDDPAAGVTYALNLRGKRVAVALPVYGSGRVDGGLALTGGGATLPQLSGDLSVSDAVLPFAGLAAAGGTAGPASAGGLPPFAFDFGVTAGRNVRVRSGNVDIGVIGGVRVLGTSAAPKLDGAFASTGGTLAYVNTVFRLQSGSVTFTPQLGVVPALDAVAIAHVIDPDPNTVRNASGSADVTLTVTGPANNLSIALSSDPSYDREQILGLLLDAPVLGASNLFGDRPQSALPYGSTSTAGISPALASTRNSNGSISVAQEAFGIANAQFTRNLLAPLETTFAGAVGLSNFNVNVDYTGNVGLSARKALGKHVNAIYATSFGYPYRQTFGFEYRPSAVAAAQVTVFQTVGAYGIDSLVPGNGLLPIAATRVQLAQPSSGSVGFSLGLQRLF